jgi:hypothetical protein
MRGYPIPPSHRSNGQCSYRSPLSVKAGAKLIKFSETRKYINNF